MMLYNITALILIIALAITNWGFIISLWICASRDMAYGIEEQIRYENLHYGSYKYRDQLLPIRNKLHVIFDAAYNMLGWAIMFIITYTYVNLVIY